MVFFDQIEGPLNIARTTGAAESITLHGVIQGCQNDGICYPPMPRSIEIPLPSASAEQLADARDTVDSENAAAPSAAIAGSTADQAEDSRLAAELAGPNRWLALLSFFGFGLLLAFTPCVFPMIPILSGIIAGAGNISTRRAFVLSLVYVLATAVVFTIAGVVAGLAGQNLQALFQQPWILTAFALIFVALSFSMFGFYELQLPTSLQTRLANMSNKQQSGSLVGVAIMGVLSALIVGPCVAPPLAASVLYIAQTRDPIFGGLALFALSMGMGAPLLLFGTAAGNLLPRAGAWMEAVKRVFGVLFLALAIWMLERFLDPFWILLMTGALLIGCAVYLGAMERIADGASGWKRLWKSLGVILLLAGALQLIGAAGGGRDPFAPLKGVFGGGSAATHAELTFTIVKSSADLDRELAAAKSAGKPVMFDFYADWCVSCKEMEKYTFTDPAVIGVLSNFVLLKADVTANDDVDQQLMRRFNIIGPPGTLFWAPDGQPRDGLRLIGFEQAQAFAERAGKAIR